MRFQGKSIGISISDAGPCIYLVLDRYQNPQYGSILLAEHWGECGGLQKKHLVGSSCGGCRDLRHRWGRGAGLGGKRWFVHPAVREMPSSPSCGNRTAKKKRLQSESAYRVCVHVHIRAGVQRGRAEGVGGVGGGGRVPVRSGASWSVSRNDT